MREKSKDFLIGLLGIIAIGSVAKAYPASGFSQPTGIISTDPNIRRQLQPAGIFALDPNQNPAAGITIYPAGPDANGQIIPPGAATLNRNPAPGSAILSAGVAVPGPQFFTPANPTAPYRRTNPDGIYPTGRTTFSLPLLHTGVITTSDIFTKGGTTFSPTWMFTFSNPFNKTSRVIPDGIYPAGGPTLGRPLQPTGIFTTGGGTTFRPTVPYGIYSAGGTTFSRPLQPTGIFTTGGTTFSRPIRPTGIFKTSGGTFSRPVRPTGIVNFG